MVRKNSKRHAHTKRDTRGSPNMKGQVLFLFVRGWDAAPLLYPFRYLASMKWPRDTGKFNDLSKSSAPTIHEASAPSCNSVLTTEK